MLKFLMLRSVQTGLDPIHSLSACLIVASCPTASATWGISARSWVHGNDHVLAAEPGDGPAGYIDLYWVHARDHTTMAQEIMRGLDDLVTSGKVLYVGISDAPAWQVTRCNTIAELRGWSRFVGLQIRYSLIDREVEHELLPMAEALDLTVTPWDTLGSGVLTGKYNRDADTAGRATLRGRISERGLKIAAEVVAVADELGCSPAQVALSWVRSRKGVIVPLIGARTRAQLDDNLGCLDLDLPDEALTRLNEVSSIRTPFSHNMLAPFRSIGSGESHRPDQH